MTRGAPDSLPQPVEDSGRRGVYQEVIDGKFAQGRRETITFCVFTSDLDEGRGDVYVAAGLALALIERGYGVRLTARTDWHRLEPTDVVVGMLPTFEPADAGSARTIAWVRNETDRWVRQAHLPSYDQVLASSELAAQRLRRATPRVDGVLPIGVDTDLFNTPDGEGTRSDTAVTTAHFWGSVRDAHRALMSLPDDADVAMYGHADGAPADLLRWHRPSVSYFAIPEIYRRARVVIDDMNRTTIGYGSVNSRFFEAAACGALPLVNGTLGAIELGFEDIPRYRDAGELGQRLRELRADPEGTAARARRVGDRVRAEHSWRVRARQLEELLDHGRSTRRSAPPPKKPVHFFPDYTSDNPFQAMLYSQLDLVGAHPVPVQNLSAHLTTRSQSRSPGVVHVHWTAPILQWTGGPYGARSVLDDFARRLHAFKEAGGRLVWTVHNVLPHDARHRRAEIALSQLLSDEADAIHVLSETTPDEVGGLYSLDPDKVTVIQHGSYVGQYPRWVTREAARARLGILPEEKVLIALGGIRPYKGLSRLVTVFDGLAERDPSLRLLVSGRPAKHPSVPALQEACDRSPRIISRFEHLPDDHLQVWLGAADLAVLPYHAVLNSGAYLLAQSFGLPVVGPRAGALAPDDGQPHVQLFDPGDDDALAAALRLAIAHFISDPDAASAARASAVAAADRFTASDMASEFARFIRPFL